MLSIMNSNSIILLHGGVSSGKSRFAVKTARELELPTVFLASYRNFYADSEMKRKINRHKKERPSDWITIEPVFDIIDITSQYKNKKVVLLLDCLSLYTSGLMMDGLSDKKILRHIKDWSEKMKTCKCNWIIVSNEVGMSPVPDSKETRRFRELLGKCNQIVAKTATQVYFFVAGIPQKIK